MNLERGKRDLNVDITPLKHARSGGYSFIAPRSLYTHAAEVNTMPEGRHIYTPRMFLFVWGPRPTNQNGAGCCKRSVSTARRRISFIQVWGMSLSNEALKLYVKSVSSALRPSSVVCLSEQTMLTSQAQATVVVCSLPPSQYWRYFKHNLKRSLTWSMLYVYWCDRCNKFAICFGVIITFWYLQFLFVPRSWRPL